MVCGAEGDVAGPPALELLDDAWRAAGRRTRYRGTDVKDCDCGEAA
jgi:hypothetical protein